jgi:hypothetical protein
MSKQFDDPRREFLITALSLGLFGGGNLASLFQSGHARGDIPDKLPEGRSIYQLRGEVSVDGKPADINTPIGPGSLVKTGRKSLVIFVVRDDAFILRSESELQMQSGDGVFVEGMRILSGKILSVFGRREKPRTFTTTTATIGIRGTGLYLESEADRSYVCTCYGAVRITANANRNITRDIVSEHHDEPVYVLPSASQDRLIVPAPFVNHTDSELSLIETLVGRTTPFAYTGGGYEVPRKRGY